MENKDHKDKNQGAPKEHNHKHNHHHNHHKDHHGKNGEEKKEQKEHKINAEENAAAKPEAPLTEGLIRALR